MRGASVDELLLGLTQGNKVALGRAITLVESTRPEDQQLASALIGAVLPAAGRAIRVGISGVPGVGKSTFVEALGKSLTGQNKKVAVLAVDPSSTRTKGSILGDKTRMEELAKDPLAFIRPTASGSQLGGVAGRTREAILLCEAAGYEVVLIETVGVGQSETAVRDMTDFFLLLMLAGAGDELQGIKKGIIEMADAIVINKADGDNLERVQRTKADLQHALHFLAHQEWGWTVKVLTCSALERVGINEVWQLIDQFKEQATRAGHLLENRQRQQKIWLQQCFDDYLQQTVEALPGWQKEKAALDEQVYRQQIHPPQAARQLIQFCIDSLKKK
jgi:LAO/AO transport system kinase